MSRFRSALSIYFAVGLMFLGIIGQDAAAQTRRSEREVRDIVRSLKSRIDDFQYNLTFRLRTNSADRDELTEIETDLRDLTSRINEFERNLDSRRENADDVSRILGAAQTVNEYLSQNPQNRRIESDWSEVRTLLNRLSSIYNVGGNSGSRDDDRNAGNNRFPRTNSTNNANSFGLTGTYQFDSSRSENISQIVADTNISDESQRRDLEEKLQSPEQIAIDIRGNQVILASSKAAPVNFVADGTTRTENTGGRTLRVRAALRGQELIIASISGDTDYTVTFTSIDGGRGLKITRRITTPYLDQTVFADSFYTKTDSIARLGINGSQPTGNYPQDDDATYSDAGSSDSTTYSSSDPADSGTRNNSPYPSTTNARRGEYIVPNGTIITGILQNDLTTKATQNNDRFRMTVQAPDQFRGATIEGYVSGLSRSGQVSGRSQITFNFERITLRNGETYDFAGFLQSVTDQNGKTVRIDGEGSAKGDSQTKETVKRGGIGAGLGAIIGAIAGGGKGAAIGAIIGGSAGAGSVIVQGKDDLELKQGSSITVQASSPLR
jgi:hypothetical protein